MKKPMLMAAIIIAAFSAHGQTIPTPQFQEIDNTVDLAVAVDNVLQPLNKSSITTNLLYDRGWKLGDLEGFDGSQGSDTLQGHNEWLHQYGSLTTAYIGTGTSPAPSITTWKAARDAAEASGKNPLVGMHIDYHRFITDSVQLSNLIYELNGQLHDYPNQGTPPYEQRKAFSFSPYITTIYDKLNITFKTSPTFFKTNYPWPVSAFEVDFGNGSGYQNVGTNSEPAVNYSTFGTKTLRLKVTYTNGQSFYAYSTLHLVQTQNYTIPGAKYSSFRDDTIYVAHPNPAEVDHGATLQIAYGCGHSKLIKPYIYVEGFNPEEFGDMNYNSLYADPNLWVPSDLYPSLVLYQLSPP